MSIPQLLGAFDRGGNFGQGHHYWRLLACGARVAKQAADRDDHLSHHRRQIFVGMFTVLEHIVGALIHHKSVSDGIEEITSKGWYELVARCVLVLVAFLPFSVSKKLDASGEGISFTLCSSGGHVDEGDSPHCRGKRDVHKPGFIGFNRVKNFSCPSNSIFPPVGRMHLCVI